MIKFSDEVLNILNNNSEIRDKYFETPRLIGKCIKNDNTSVDFYIYYDREKDMYKTYNTLKNAVFEIKPTNRFELNRTIAGLRLKMFYYFNNKSKGFISHYYLFDTESIIKYYKLHKLI